MVKKKPKDKFEEAKINFETWVTQIFGGKDTSKTSAGMEKNHALFSSLTERFDLVTRKEFNAQQKTLKQAVKKLDELEKLLKGSVKKPAAKKKAAAKKPAKKKKA